MGIKIQAKFQIINFWKGGEKLVCGKFKAYKIINLNLNVYNENDFQDELFPWKMETNE